MKKKKLVNNLVFRYNLCMIEYLYGKFVDRLIEEFPQQAGFREANDGKVKKEEELSKIFKTNAPNWRKCRVYVGNATKKDEENSNESENADTNNTDKENSNESENVDTNNTDKENSNESENADTNNTDKENGSESENDKDSKNPYVTKYMLEVFDGTEGQKELESYIIGEKYLVNIKGLEYKNVKKIILPSEIIESLDRVIDNYFKYKNTKNKKGVPLMLHWLSIQLGERWKIRINEGLDERVIEEVDRLMEYLTLGKMEELKIENLKRIRDKLQVKAKEINAVYTYRELVKKVEKEREN